METITGVTYSREWIYDKENLVITKDEGDTKEFTIEVANIH